MTINHNMSEKSTEKIGLLEEEAFKRKERLKALKRKADHSGSDSNEQTENKPVFRSYKPQDETLLEKAIVSEVSPIDLQSEVQTQLDLLKTPMVIDEIDIASLAPRKPDWDLKRDVSKKLEKLEKRTQRAIAELIRDRLKTNQENILQAVNVAASQTALEHENADDD